MAEGCVASVVKFSLFITNFLIFLLSLGVLGCGIWVLVDKPSFLDLFEQAEEQFPAEIGDGFDITLYTSASYIIIVVAALVAIMSFFGCFGAWKESKCMLGTYFVLILVMFIVMVVGAVLAYTGDLQSTLKEPLLKALGEYKDNPQGDPQIAFKNVWNEVQAEMKCCGVNNGYDWKNSNPDFSAGGSEFKVPVGCCHWQKNADGAWVDLPEAERDVCRKTVPAEPWTDKYAFEGCFTSILNEIEESQGIVAGIAIGVVVVMFLNMLFSFAMCTMVN